MVPEQHDPVPELIALPAPTPWPMITAFGITLLCTGLVTHVAISVVGLILALRGAVGWCREDLPVERHAPVPMRPVGQRAQPGKAASSPCLRPGSTLALRGRGFNPALDQGDAHAPLEPQHKVPRPNWRGLNG